jgi:hypothetical protein
MASIPSNRPPPICHDAANMVGTLFTRALKEETGLNCRSPGKALPAATRGGGHSRTSSLGGCGACSLILGHGTKDNANKDGVVSMVRNGEPVPVPRLRHGASAVSYTSSEESRGRGAHRRGKPSVSPSRVEIRAGAVSACTGLGREHTPSRGGGDVRHSPKEASDSRMVLEVPPEHLHSAHGEAKQRNPRRKHSKPFYTAVPARRQWAPGSGPFAHPRHHPRGHGSGGAWRGAQRWHPRRKPVWTGADEDVRRHFHAGRTPGPQ